MLRLAFAISGRISLIASDAVTTFNESPSQSFFVGFRNWEQRMDESSPS
ncbi:MAG: hypothetical protein WAM14_04590 [Candidatus Nitrosopolaris sp.]